VTEAAVPVAAPTLRIVTYNVNHAGEEGPTLDAIERADGDVVLLQETTARWERALRERLAAAYPYMVFRHWRRGAGGLAVLARVAIAEEALLPAADEWFPAQRLVVAASPAADAVEILHVHLRPAIDQGDWVRGYFSTPPYRLREIQGFWQRMVPGRLRVVAGDFNEEPGATALGFLEHAGLRRADSGAEPTWQWAGNWRGSDVQLRMKLDHILVDERIAVRQAWVIAGGGSDHQPVVADLAIPPRASA
jgi:endonuclease/exonuclease/phosphatase (EEP) superfamily protein YafD